MIDVIIPVYRGLEATRRCIESALADPGATLREIVVVDDASPEPEVAAYVAGLAAQGRVTLLRNEANAGFVRSVNRAMALHGDRDVVLLNSDTEVANDWLARIAAHAAADAKIATITPFSNNATICSYPFEGWRSGVPGTLGLAGLDQLVARTHRGKALDIPTGVGFCMYIRRGALAELGLFDAERFGRGYGEENDFCMKAGKAGWRNVLAADIFVYHEGSVSFAEDRFALMDASAKALVEAHPDYPRKVREWIMRDPAGDVRSAIDVARAMVSLEEAEAVVAERLRERQLIVNGLWHLEQIAEDRESRIGELHLGLEHASSLITQRDQAVAQLDTSLRAAYEEMGRLREGLAHAESLAFARQAELQRIYTSRRWRYLHRLSRLMALARGRGSA